MQFILTAYAHGGTINYPTWLKFIIRAVTECTTTGSLIICMNQVYLLSSFNSSRLANKRKTKQNKKNKWIKLKNNKL